MSPSATKKGHLTCIKQIKCDMDSRIKLNVFKEMVNDFRTKNMALETICEKLFFSFSNRI